MPRFLSPEWAAAFDAALGGVALPQPDDAGLVAAGGHFTVVQEVHGAPDGTIVVRLAAADGSLHLSIGDEPPLDGLEATGPARPADVTLSLSYEDAVALAKGELMTADALTAGRIKVRGDLSVLVASQRMLAAAQPHLTAVTATTTY